jgi:hypothetical protein
MIEAQAGELTLTRGVTVGEDVRGEIRLRPMLRAAALLVAPHLLALGGASHGRYLYAVALPGGPGLLELAFSSYTGPTVALRVATELKDEANEFLARVGEKVMELCPQSAAKFGPLPEHPDLPF